MKIDSYSIGMESARSYKASGTTARRLQIKDYRERDVKNELKLIPAWREWQTRSGGATKVAARTSAEQTYVDIREQTIRYIFDMLFAKRRGRLRQWEEENRTNVPQNEATQNLLQSEIQKMPVGVGTKLNFWQEYVYEETEETSFSTVGTVKTSDGREIGFNVNVVMSRSFTEYYREELELTAFNLCDPLVLNFDTDVAELKDQTFFFDIDGDGEKDEVARLGSGSGYLALDKNEDGVINDGTELFGTSSGNGFSDLAAYDEDGNGWIDENDAVWQKLKIWVKDESGKDILYRLKDKGVGAVCLQNVDTNFAQRGNAGKMLGNIRKSGVFLYENGNVGTVQHLDVAKYDKEA